MSNNVKNFINNIEEYDITLSTCLLLLGTIIFIRVVLEEIVSHPGMFPPITFILQSLTFFMSSFLSAVLLVSVLSRERVEKVSKVILYAYSIIIIGPIIDYLLKGVAYYNYIYDNTVPLSTPNWGYLLRAYLTFGIGIRGVTQGQQVEIILFLIFSTLFVWFKTRSIIRSIITPLAVYTVTFLYGSIPNYISYGKFNEVFNSTHNNSYDSSVFTVLILIQSALWLLLFDKTKLLYMLSNLTSGRGLHYLAMVAFGGLIGGAGVYPIFLAILCIILLWLTSVCINDMSDVMVDTISNKRNVLIHGPFNNQSLKEITLFYALLSLLFASVLGYSAMIITLLILTISVLYSLPPFRTKKYPLISIFTIAAGAVSAFALGFYADVPQIAFPTTLILAMLVCFTLAFNTKDLKDFEGDKDGGIWTIPVLFGLERGRIVIASLDLMSYILAPLILGLNNLVIPATVFGVATFLVVLRKESKEWQIFLIYFFFLAFMIIMR